MSEFRYYTEWVRSHDPYEPEPQWMARRKLQYRPRKGAKWVDVPEVIEPRPEGVCMVGSLMYVSADEFVATDAKA